MDDRLLTIADVCKLFQCSERSINRMVNDDLLHPVRIRGLVRYRSGEVDNLIEMSGFDSDSDECQCDEKCQCPKLNN